MRSVFYTIFILISLVAASFAQSKKPAPFGVNLSGAEFGSNIPGVYNTDYGYPNAEDLDYFKLKGLTLIRLPFLWERIQPVLNGPLDSVELKRIVTIIDAAAQRGLWILPDMHNYCRRKVGNDLLLVNSPKVSLANVADAWTKLAAVLKNKKNIWGYGLMNEPHDMPSADAWFNIAQAIINGIRSVDKKTTILVGGDGWSSAERWPAVSDNLKKLKDPSNNLIFEAHLYFDKNSSGAYKYTYEEEGATPQTGVERAKPFVEWLKANNLRGLIGEYGVPDNDPRWLVTLDNLLSYLQRNGVNGTYWSAGPRWGDYTLAVQPGNGADRPQMKVLGKYKFAGKLKK